MMRAFASISFIALLSGAAYAQTPGLPPDPSISAAAPPVFEAADVHPSAHGANLYMTGGVLRGGRYDIRNATMLDLVRTAYSVDDDSKIQGGPNWLELDRFDVIAKAPPSATQDSAKLMLQALLADRFKLVVHTGSKPLQVFVLSLGKGKPKLKESDGTGAPGCQGPPNQAPPEPGVIQKALVQCRNMTMDKFAPQLRGMAGAYLGANPIVNQTGLEGTWDFDLTWTAKALLPAAGADGVTIFDAVDKQLGLKVELQKIATPVIVVDSVNQKPSPNPPGVSTNLPPPAPTEFEVADIKPSKPDAQTMGRLQPGGRLDLQGFPMKQLITLAWDINSDDLLAEVPKWMDNAKFDVIAKASTSTNGAADAPQVDIDDIRVMLRALLVERFKMKVHTEQRPVPAYVLTAVKPKLQKADPTNRTGCHEGPGADGKDPRIANPILSRLITCQNMTIAQLSEQLQYQAGGYVHTPVLDSTGLTDAYDFTLSFSAIGVLQNGLPGTQPGAGGANASDPNGGISLPDAVSKQLGLKMELQKRPMPVLVIDHVEEKPIDN
jgi:uncharacterized protein (TIGR03435 family)